MKTFKLIMFRFFVLMFCLMTGISAYADGTININTGSWNGSGFTFVDGVLTITTNGYYDIIGNGMQTENRIMVDIGVIATISLSNVNIVSSDCAFSIGDYTILQVLTQATLLLKGSNTLVSGSESAGIYVPSCSELIIDSKENPGYETGKLTVKGGNGGAGIGGRNNRSAGIITINGGIVTASGGAYAAGIGGGGGGNGGTITINGGIVTATALASTYDPACIGGGAQGDAGTITITGGAVIAKGGSGGSIGRGGPNGASSSGSITISGGSVYATGNGIGMSGQGGRTASTETSIGDSAIVFANTINPNATIAYLARTKAKLLHTIDNNGNVTISLDINLVDAFYSIHKLIIPNGITFTINSIYDYTLSNYGIIQNFGTIQGNSPIMNNGTIINNGVINNGGVTTNPVETGILGEWIQDIPAQFYTGDSITPDVTIIRPGTGTLIQGQDYSIENYSNNTYSGTAMVTIKGIGNYAGTMTKTFNIDGGTCLIDLNNIHTNDIYQYGNNVVTINQDYNYLITGTTKTDRVVVQSGVTATITLDSASITSSNHALDVDSGASITLLLKKSNVLQTTEEFYAGLHVPAGSAIFINSADVPGSENGTLTANSKSGAAIGGGKQGSCGSVTINGGTINAYSDGGGAAIGVGESGSNNSTTITINGGIVNANSSSGGAAIGGGKNRNSGIVIINGGIVHTNSSGGGAAIGSGADAISSSSIVIINGGTINADSGSGGAAIGGGIHSTATITINGGTIDANSSGGGAAIGVGQDCSNNTVSITINDGTIDAGCSGSGAGIGSGRSGSIGAIIINGGTINASSTGGAGIGGGQNSSNNIITISGGIINAIGGSQGAGIGSGYSGEGGSITISNGIINAIGGSDGAGIGSGSFGEGGSITISNGIINAIGGYLSAGIGGGHFSNVGSITINGGSISATGGRYGTGIGAGKSGGSGTFSMNGNAMVFASSVSDDSPKTKGILFNGDTGTMYGNVILKQNATIPSGKTWNITSDQIFEIAPNDTLTHNGTIYNYGAINNFGIIDGTGTIIGNSVIDEDITEYDNFDRYKITRKLAVADILGSPADLTGGIIGTIGFDDYDDENDFFDPRIGVIVLDKETETTLYDIYIDETSNTYTSKHKSNYIDDDIGEASIFFPDDWESNDIQSSIQGIEDFRYQNGGIPPSAFLQDSIDVTVKITVYNAKFNSAKIPGIGLIYLEDLEGGSGSASLLDSSAGKEKDCFDLSMQDQCPCNIWEKIKSPDKTKNADLIIAAHRGTWGYNLGSGPAENSSAAIIATANKTNVIEVDVMMTHDGALVLSHDYGLKRLSNYSGNSYWFDVDYDKETPSGDNVVLAKDSKLRKRNGSLSEDKYLLFSGMLNILKKKGLVAFIDIKPLMAKKINGVCIINCEYDNTPQGRENIRKNWVSILKKCFEKASDKDALDYIAFKPNYRPDQIAILGNGTPTSLLDRIPKKLFLAARYMPVIQSSEEKTWEPKFLRQVIGFIGTWMLNPNNVMAFETNFKSLDEVYLKKIKDGTVQYENLLHYVYSKGRRPGIFGEDPVGPKGLASRWGDWRMKNSEKDIRGDHLLLMSVPYFETAVITSDRYGVWSGINSQYNATSLLSETMAHFEENTSTGTDIVNTAIERINVRYIPGSIIIEGLNKEDINSDIILYDTQGRLIYKDKVKNSPQTIISKIVPKGIYILKLSGNRQITVKLTVNQ